MAMVIDNKFEVGQIVYLITDKEQAARIVTAMNLRTEILYELSCGTTTSWHREFEMTTELNILAKVD